MVHQDTKNLTFLSKKNAIFNSRSTFDTLCPQQKEIWFSLHHHFDYAPIMKKQFICSISLMCSIRHEQGNKYYFSFHHYGFYALFILKNIFLHLPATLTTSLKKSPNNVLLTTYVKLKLFFCLGVSVKSYMVTFPISKQTSWSLSPWVSHIFFSKSNSPEILITAR